jgi:Ser-tRNA(Ala) deacylase AlaX
MTRKLYWEDPYQVEFDAVVLKIDGNRVILDKTCFFPKGGGQVGDIGEINGVKVVDTQKDETYTVTHILEKEPPFKVGDLVHGKIDWERRYKIMKLHSAAHIVYYLMQEVFGETCKPSSSGLLDDKKDRSDYFFTDKLDLNKLKRVEEKANEIISKGYEIQTWSDEQDPNRRYWKIEIFPVMACGGTHPRNTREIGRIRLDRGKKPGSGRERIEISLI